MKRDADEKALLESVERGEWKSAKGGKRERARYSRYAKATFRKDRRLNIRLLSKDLEAIQKRALAEGLPYQTLISSLLHKYASGRLKEVSRHRLFRFIFAKRVRDSGVGRHCEAFRPRDGERFVAQRRAHGRHSAALRHSTWDRRADRLTDTLDGAP